MSMDKDFSLSSAVLPKDEAGIIEALSKANGLMADMWRLEEKVTTTEQVAKFYGVPLKTIQAASVAHKAELEENGMRTLRGEELKKVRAALQANPYAPHVTVWTPRATVLLGWKLRDSLVARRVRDLCLDIIYSPAAELPEPPLMPTIKEKPTTQLTPSTPAATTEGNLPPLSPKDAQWGINTIMNILRDGANPIDEEECRRFELEAQAKLCPDAEFITITVTPH